MPSVIVIGFVKLDPLFGDDFVPEGSTACLVYDDSSGNKNLFTGSDACYSISAGGYYRLNAEVENNQYYDIYVRLNFKILIYYYIIQKILTLSKSHKR